MPDVLFFRPNYELATSYLYEWFGLGVAAAEAMGYRVIDIPKEAATQQNLFDALSTYEFSLIFLGGHGNPDTFTGHNSSIVFRACQNDEAVSGNIAYMLSCSVGQILGPSMISKNCTAWLGYQMDFNFLVDTSKPILQDPLAEPFKDIVYEIMLRLMRGEKIKQVYEGGIAKCNEWIQVLHDRTGTEWSDVISFLEHDRNALIALGDQEVYSTPGAGVVIAGVMPYNLIPLGLGIGMIYAALT